MKKPKGMFIFSKAMDRRSDLKKWESHFRKKGIKTEVITKKGKFYLCREGKEAKERKR